MDRKYYAHLKIKEFYREERFFKNVYVELRRIVYDCQREREKYDLSKLIYNYCEDNCRIEFAKDSILKLFTEEEINTMSNYFEQPSSFPQIEFCYGEQGFPVDPNTIPFDEVEDCCLSWTFNLQGDGYPIHFDVGGYVHESKHEKISHKPKEDLFEKYNLFYAFENVFDGLILTDRQGHYLTATNAGEMLEVFTALLLIKKRTSQSNTLTILNKMHDWINREDGLKRLDSGYDVTLECSSYYRTDVPF